MAERESEKNIKKSEKIIKKINFIFLILFMNAFVIIHFGNNVKYLELELYMIINLKKCTKYDIIYLYSVNDTPDKFIKIIKNYCNTIPYNDDNITYNITNFKSVYTHFNILRTCNFIFAYQLIKYKKICILESDMIILKNIDNIFELNVPSILYYNSNNILENNLIKIDYENTLNECNKISKCNGGLMLIKPSMSIYNRLLKNIKIIIEKKCMYPNETLFLISNKKIYNLPFYFNGIKYYLDKFIKNNTKEKLCIIHFNGTYKYLDYIKDNYLKKIKSKILYYFLNKYKNNHYLVYNNEINKLIKNI